MAKKPRKLFRQAALDRLASPEQLDRLVTVTDPHSWVMLLSIAVLLLFLIVMSIFGTIPSHVNGQGIFLNLSGQVVDAMSQASGSLTKFTVSLHQNVQKGQQLAIIDQAETAKQWQNALAVVKEKQEQLHENDADFKRESALKNAHFEKRKVALNQSIHEAQNRISYLQRTLAIREKHAASGMLTRESVEDTRAELSKVRQELSDKQQEILKINDESLDLELNYQHNRTKLVQEIHDAQRSADQFKLTLTRNVTVLAPASGRIIEFKLSPGAVVEKGQALLSIETSQGDLQALLYIPTEHGKKLYPGQAVRIEPATIKKEQFGTLIGVIREISEFPVTKQGIVSILQNQSLADAFSQGGSPYAVHVDLIKDSKTASGYRWTSLQGPPNKIFSGTTLRAEITVDEQPPITLLIPFLRKTTGIYQ